MLRRLKKITLQVMMGANVVTILMMLAVGYAGYLSPESFPMMTNAGLAFPLFMVINFLFIIFWIIFKPRLVLVPVVGFLVCYQPVRTYMPLNIPHQDTTQTLKVLSYNVMSFGNEKNNTPQNAVLQYIARQKADIVCLQEAVTSAVGQANIDSVLGPLYAYRDSSHVGVGDEMWVYSRYPIVNKENIPYPSVGNHSTAFYLNIDGETVLLVNNHFETVGLSEQEQSDFSTMLDGKMHSDSVKTETTRLVDKLSIGAKKRAPEARAVASYMRKRSYMPIICVGDFNDGPLSYAHRTVAEDLTDCFVAAGNGLGISYHHNRLFVRIDNIMCSDDWIPIRTIVDRKIKQSDHYPIITWLKKSTVKRKNQ